MAEIERLSIRPKGSDEEPIAAELQFMDAEFGDMRILLHDFGNDIACSTFTKSDAIKMHRWLHHWILAQA